jgi:hypothetical protein
MHYQAYKQLNRKELFLETLDVIAIVWVVACFREFLLKKAGDCIGNNRLWGLVVS